VTKILTLKTATPERKYTFMFTIFVDFAALHAEYEAKQLNKANDLAKIVANELAAVKHAHYRDM
jgi:hypothetical protein